MGKFINYEESLIESLKDPVAAQSYLNAVLEEGDRDGFLLALRDITEAKGGIRVLSELTNISKPALYKMFSSKGNPEWGSLIKVIKALGMTFRINPLISSYRVDYSVEVAESKFEWAQVIPAPNIVLPLNNAAMRINKKNLKNYLYEPINPMFTSRWAVTDFSSLFPATSASFTSPFPVEVKNNDGSMNTAFECDSLKELKDAA